MKRIAIVTDSSAGIPPELVRKFDLNLVPIGVQINQQFYREGVDLEQKYFYDNLESSRSISTSQPSPGDFLEVFTEVARKAQEIISIHVTSKGSGTVSVANLTARDCDCPVTVIDSETAGMAQGFIALAAAQGAMLGHSKQEILSLIERVKKQTSIFVAVPTLKYLEKSGRISSAKRMIGSVLSIKPILGVKDGIVDVVEMSRSYPRALQRLLALIEEGFSPQEQSLVAIMHSGASQEATNFKHKVEERLGNSKVFLTEMGASLAVHGGRGMIGIAAYSGNDLQI